MLRESSSQMLPALSQQLKEGLRFERLPSIGMFLNNRDCGHVQAKSNFNIALLK